ncbi:MAG: uracil-DNA glycosylase [Deltaproteobacteria bacterium]|nr:uracil-DNA glycosylase [Deltaproteobacteria bacterium]
MISPVVTGRPVVSPVMLIGQAPGPKEGFFGQPFAWTAGKTMFKWFSSIGIEEEDFRNRAFMAAVCRCFPGKNPKGGDRVPDDKEIANCSRWLNEEIDLLKPKLIITVGKLAICQFLEVSTLDKIIGRKLEIKRGNLDIDLIPLPHPSGASTWHRMEPGQTLLKKALNLLKHHEAWQSLL